MGAAIDTGDKKSVDVQLNIVPFIDLMSCLTAFLLVTAAWSNLAQISIKPKGLARSEALQIAPPDEVKASLLIQDNVVWVCISRINDIRRIEKAGEEYNWKELLEVLTEHKKSSYLAERQDIEIAAEDKITYQAIISAMDMSIAAGFIDVGLADPASLSCRPQL